MHAAAGRPGDPRRGGRAETTPSDTRTQVNKQKRPPRCLDPPPPSRPHPGRRGRGTRWGVRAGAPGRAQGGSKPRRAGVPGAQSRARGRGAHSPFWWNCSSSSFQGVRARGPRPGGPSRGGRRRCPRRRRSTLPPPGGLASFVAPVTLRAGLPGARTHAHARSPPLGALHPGAHAVRVPERPPGPAAPRAPRAVGGPARAPRFHPGAADVASSE